MPRFSGLAMGPGGASQAGLTATRTSKVSKRHRARPCCDGFCTLKKSLQSQPGRHKSQRLCAASSSRHDLWSHHHGNGSAAGTGTKALLPPDRPVRGPDGEGSVPEKGCILQNSLPICLHSGLERAPRSFSLLIPSQQVVFLPRFCLGRGFLLLICSPKGLQERPQLELAKTWMGLPGGPPQAVS